MPTCSQCGSEIEFRYIDGRCIPLHIYGGGCGGSARSDVNDYAGYSHSKESRCFQTQCPECHRPVYFIRHNGGSVWIDPPLGPPWYKHLCMDKAYVASSGVRSTVVSESRLAEFKARDGLIMGIVSETETSLSKRCTLINIETGKDQSIVLLIKNNAGFLAGGLVVYDQRGKSVSLIEDDSYTFRVVVRLKPRYERPDSLALRIECPECLGQIGTGEIANHLARLHGFPSRIDLSRIPDQPVRPLRKLPAGRSTRTTAVSPQHICPNPSRWSEVFQKLLRHAETHDCDPDRPPAPLILNGWAFSNDVQKMQRWKETVDWAEANGCRSIVERISHQDFYTVEKPSAQPIGPRGGPCYRPWDFEVKERPEDHELAKHFEHLSAHWTEIAGPRLSAVTRPVSFTGKKARRLLVQTESTASPPWGGWSHRDTDEPRRRTFTLFRSAVNAAIGPHEVDHISFVETSGEKQP